MIFLPDLAQVQNHIESIRGQTLSLVQDHQDAIRIIAYEFASKENRHYHVYQDENGKVERVELCESTGKFSDGKLDYRPHLPCHHPDLGYEISAMIHVAREVIEESGISEIEITTYCNATRHSQEFASNFHPRRMREDGTSYALDKIEKYHIPKGELLREIGSHIAKHFELTISYDGDCDYGGELSAKISKNSLRVEYTSDDEEASAGFVIESVFKNGRWEHSTDLWFDAPDDPVSRMEAIANPMAAFETHVEEHANLSSIVPTISPPIEKSNYKNEEIIFSIRPGLLFGHDEGSIVR